MGVKASLVEQPSATSQPIKISLPHVLFSSFVLITKSFIAVLMVMPVELPVPHEAPINFLSGALFFKNKFGLGGKKNIFQTTFLKNNKFFPIYVYQKGGPNFTISPIPAFVGHLLQIF
jgi:hypothetical protein